MKTSEIGRTVAGLSVALAMVGGLAFGGTSRVDASGDAVNCSVKPTICQVDPAPQGGTPGGSPWSGILAPPATTIAQVPDPYIDLFAFVAGQNVDGSPVIFIRNAGTLDAGAFEVLEQTHAGSHQMHINGIPAGQSVPFTDPKFPADCGGPVTIRVNVKYSVSESNYSNNVLTFTPACPGGIIG